MAHLEPRIRPFYFFCQQVFPLLYDGSLSEYEVLCKVRAKLNEVIAEVNRLEESVEQQGSMIGELQDKVTEIEEEIEKIKNGEYIGNYIDALRDWIDKNLKCLFTRMVKYVFFGLTDDGHFAAYIPDCWRFLNFDTPLDIQQKCYGHLILKW